jgi:tellurite resistance protein
MDIKKLVDEIIADNMITMEERDKLNEAIMSDGKVTEEEQEQIKRIFQLIGEGKLKIEG